MHNFEDLLLAGKASTVDFGYKERGYKEQPFIWNKCQWDGFFT